MVGGPSAGAGGAGSGPGWGGSHMLWSGGACGPRLLGLCSGAHELRLLRPAVLCGLLA